MSRLVSCSGLAGAGKDTAATALIDRGFVRIAFADAVKQLAREIGWNGEKDETGRALLQNLGDGARRVIGEDVWTNLAFNQMYQLNREGTSVVLTDARYPNELEYVREVGGLTLWIERPGLTLINNHASETSITSADFSVQNIVVNDGSIDDLRRKVEDRVWQWIITH